MCKYCRERGRREEITENYDFIIKIKKKKVIGISLDIEVKEPKIYCAYSVGINYCPMCGRRLGGE